MAQVAYLIASHTRPAQIVRLARTLRAGNERSEIVISHDFTGSEFGEHELEALSGAALLPARPVQWGTFSEVERLLDAFDWTLRNRRCDWLVVLSGQDYPIQPVAAIERFLAEADCDAFVLASPVGPDAPDGIGTRYYYRFVALPRGWPRWPRLLRAAVERTVNVLAGLGVPVVFWAMSSERVPPRIGIRRLRTPFGPDFRCYWGSEWLIVSRRAADAIVAARRSRGLVRHYRRTVHPEESFVNTVLCNDPELEVNDDYMRYVVWGEDAPHPTLLTLDDLDAMLASGKLFARKFDIDVDARVLDEIDARVHGRADAV